MTQEVAQTGRVVLEGALTIRTAEAVRDMLRAAIESDADVAIDCARATEVDLSFVQLLIATRTSAGRTGHAVSLVASPDGALLDALSSAGFDVVAADSGGFWFEGHRA